MVLLPVFDALALQRLKPLAGVDANQGTRLGGRGRFADTLFRRQAD